MNTLNQVIYEINMENPNIEKVLSLLDVLREEVKTRLIAGRVPATHYVDVARKWLLEGLTNEVGRAITMKLCLIPQD